VAVGRRVGCEGARYWSGCCRSRRAAKLESVDGLRYRVVAAPSQDRVAESRSVTTRETIIPYPSGWLRRWLFRLPILPWRLRVGPIMDVLSIR